MIWIDAICINQDDVAERSQQVSIMAKVYSSSLSNLVMLAAHVGRGLAERMVEAIDTLYADAERQTNDFQMLHEYLFTPSKHVREPYKLDWGHHEAMTACCKLPWFR
jgi:hypothetical protein